VSEWLTTAWERFGPRARDVLFVAVALLAAFAETMARRHDGLLAWTLVGAAALVGALALWWRRRFPVAVTLIGLAVVAATGLPVVAFVGLFTLAVCRRDRVLVVLGALAIATLAITWSFDTADGWGRLVASAALVVGFVVTVGAYVGARHDLVVALRERAARAEADQELRTEQARLAERARIAREMHDVLAHKVSLIALQAGALEVQAAPTPAQVTASAELIRATAGEAMDDLREVLGVLRADPADRSDVVPPAQRDDIVSVVEASRRAGMQVELRLDVGEMPDALARTVHRVVREGLTNVHKHARGAATLVTVTADEGREICVEVVNRRPVGGGSLLPGSGVGLLGLAERVDLLGGTLDSGACPDGGWHVRARLPWLPGSAP
jgi:signal transduction histidine kinase